MIHSSLMIGHNRPVRRVSLSLRMTALLVFVVGGLMASLPAAAEVVNLTTGQLLVFDSNDKQPANKVSHIAHPDDMDAAPVGEGGLGGFSVTVSGKRTNVQVTDHVGLDDPGAYSGNNYLRICRGDGGGGAIRYTFRDEQARDGDRIHLTEMVYVSNKASQRASIMVYDKAVRGRRITIVTKGDGTVAYLSTDGWVTVPGVRWMHRRWQKWEIDYPVGAATCTLSIDGKSRREIPVYSPGPVGSVVFGAGRHVSPVYFDEQRSEPDNAPTPVGRTSANAGTLRRSAHAPRETAPFNCFPYMARLDDGRLSTVWRQSDPKRPSNNNSPLPLGEGPGVRADRKWKYRSCFWTATNGRDIHCVRILWDWLLQAEAS